MRFEEKQITLNDGTALTLRSPQEEDAQGTLAFLKTTAAQTHYLLRMPDEVSLNAQEEEVFLRAVLYDSRRIMICAFLGSDPVGSLYISPIGDRRKVRHRAQLGMAVIRDCWNLGIGSLLMREGLRAAGSMGFEQMELSVCADNSRAIRLYERFGFEQWGRLKNAFRLAEGVYLDDLLMVRPLDSLPY